MPFDGALNWNIFFEEGVLFAAGSLTPGQNWNLSVRRLVCRVNTAERWSIRLGTMPKTPSHGRSPGRGLSTKQVGGDWAALAFVVRLLLWAANLIY
jgi:hypothetical protein